MALDARVFVIGSGPAAVSCAYALVERGYAVTVLDAGIELEPERAQAVQRLQRIGHSAWDDESLRFIREGANATANGIPIKRVYGSDFPYRDVAKHMPLRAERVTPFASLAKGGLSNVWGAAVVPYRPADIADWPISAAQLAPYYDAIFRFMPLAAIEDDLAELFPLHTTAFQSFTPSRQASRLLTHMGRHRDRLRSRGIRFGRSRLAVRVQPLNGAPGCVYCGLCMYGCPHDLIYTSSHTLDRLVASGRVRYVRDVIVDDVRESGCIVTIHAHERQSGSPLALEADRVFVGCGVLPTARLMLRSLGTPDATLTMRDSQYFLLPLLALRGGNPEPDQLHTLAQLFIELFDASLGEYPVHLQVYTYNELYARAMRSMAGVAYPLVKLPAGMLLKRLLVIQGYLHSNISGSVAVSLRDGTLMLERVPRKEAARTVKAAVRILRRNARSLGFTPLSPLLKIGNPGQGAHFGGIFPMREQPGPFESDTMGRPTGFTRVHLVDASVLPTIPSTTITLNAMANAYRIGSEWDGHV